MKLRDLNSEEIEKLRYRAKTDLFFLAHDVLEKERMMEGTHRAMCEFFVHKSPLRTFKEFADGYQGPKDRLILVPRKAFKSTIKIIDNLQWNLCFPDISILTLTATRDLATAFVEEFQQYFIIKGSERNRDGLIKGGSPTIFQELFREFCITEKEATTSSGKFISPARKTFSKEPTIGALSIGSSGSGWSCDIIDLDDVLSDDNTDTGMQLAKLEKRIAMAKNLKKKYGFRHIVGTRYDPSDAYGVIAEKNGVNFLYGDFENDSFKYMCKPCWWLKGKPYEQPDYDKWKPAEAEMDLFFPEELTFKVLLGDFRENQETFFSQQLNDPMRASGAVFGEDFIRECIVDHTSVPRKGTMFTFWDLAYGRKQGADYRVGVHGFLDDQGRWWIVAMTRGRFSPAELPFQVVNSMRVYKPRQTSIEDSVGARWLEESFQRHALEMGVTLNVNWVPVENTENSKRDRMEALAYPMKQKRLFFLNTIDSLDDLIKEFKTVGNPKKRNDIPDAIAQLVKTYSPYALSSSLHTPAEDARMWKELEDREFHDLIFQRGRYESHTPELPAPVESEPDDYYIDPCTGLPSPTPY